MFERLKDVWEDDPMNATLISLGTVAVEGVFAVLEAIVYTYSLGWK